MRLILIRFTIMVSNLLIVFLFDGRSQADVTWVKKGSYFACRQKVISFNPDLKITPVLYQELEELFPDITTELPPSVLRLPPDYPYHCEPFAENEEYVIVIYNIDINGVVDDVYVPLTSNPCFIVPAVETVCRWKYERTENGVENAISKVTFLLQE